MWKSFLYKKLCGFVFPNKGITHVKRSPKLIVSLTSWPGRITVVSQAIESILKQSLKPDLVILWLAESQFPKKEKQLPRDLLRLKKGGLQIRWYHEDIKPYKKLIPSLEVFPDDIIVTADDDIIYGELWLEKMYWSYIRHPNDIQGHHAFLHKMNSKKKIESVGVIESSKELTGLEMLASGGGILFPPHSLDESVLRSDIFLKLAPTNDDFWYWAMARINSRTIRLIDNFDGNVVCIDGTQELAMNEGNEAAFMVHFQNIIDTFPQLWKYCYL